MTRKFSSISVETTLASGISNSQTTLTVASGTGSALLGGVTLAAGNVDQFTLAIDPDTTNEEIVFATAVASDTFTITRGRAGSSAISHSGGATVRHVLTSDDLTFFNTGVATADAAIPKSTVTTKGDLIAATASATVNRLAIGSSNQSLLVDNTTSTGLKWAASPTSVLTATGDILYASAANTLERRAIGSTGEILTVAGGVPTWAAAPNELPSQTGNNGKYLKTDGSTASWDNIDITISAKTANYTLVASDVNKLLTMSSSSTTTFTVPSGVFTEGQQINVQGIGSGLVQIRNNGTSVLTSTGATAGAPNLRAQYSAATIICTSSNNFTVIGDLA
jgi:hypothetical protein